MDTPQRPNDRPVNPRRKRKTKLEIFREAYLPFILVALSVFVIVGIIAAIATGNESGDPSSDPSNSSTQSQLQQQAQQLLSQAQELALAYDFDGALATLDLFEGDLKDFPQVKQAIDDYTIITHNMVSWTADKVANLSFHVLVADLKAALADQTYGQDGNNKYNRNFITTDEFWVILQQLYERGYVLVNLSDLYVTMADGSIAEKILKLPQGKQPLLLTETHCNYYTYMEQSHGFASKLCYDGSFYNEMVTSDGTTLTGAYDLVPLLENFIRQYPDFSYKGARAILAFSGYDGVFGYRITSDTLSKDALTQETAEATALATALRDSGYTLACYTYANADYSTKSVQDIRSDIQLWQEQVGPVIGQTDILVFAQESDIGTSYKKNDKFDALYQYGFRYFLGSSSILFREVGGQYVRHNRLMVTGSNLSHHADWFKELLDPTVILDPRRGNIPK